MGQQRGPDSEVSSAKRGGRLRRVGGGGGADGRCNYSVNPELFIPLFGAVLC